MKILHIIYILVTASLLFSCNNTTFSKKDKFKTLEGTIWLLDYDISSLDKNGSGYGIYYPGLNSRKIEFISPTRVIVSDTYSSNSYGQPKVRHLSYSFSENDQKLTIEWDEKRQIYNDLYFNVQFIAYVNKETGIMIDKGENNQEVIFRRIK